MFDTAAIVCMLLDHKIAAAERVSPTSAEMRAMTSADMLLAEAQLADLYNRRRLALEEMMRAPFQPACSHA